MPTPPTIECTRHVRRLSEQETDELVEAVADLIVHVLTGRRDPARVEGDGPERHHARDGEQPAVATRRPAAGHGIAHRERAWA